MARPRPFQSLFKSLFRTVDVQKEIFALPIAADTDVLKNDIDIHLATGTFTFTTPQPDYPRNITINTTDAAGDNLAGTVTVVGTNVRGETISEVFTIVAGTDAYVGNKAFATVVSGSWSLSTAAASDVMDIGVGSKLGLSKPALSIVKETFNGADRAVGTLNTTNNTYTSGATLDGTKAVEVIYRVKY